MKALTIFAFLAVAFAAVAAAPSKNSVTARRMLLPNETGVQAIDEDFLLDLISLILGVDVREIIRQYERTVDELDALLLDASQEVLDILGRGGAQYVAEAQQILADAIAEAEHVVTPLVNLIKQLLALIGKKGMTMGLIEEVVKFLVNQILGLIRNTVNDLQAVAAETVAALDALAQRAGQDISNEVNAVLELTVGRAVQIVTPLIELLLPLLPPGNIKGFDL